MSVITGIFNGALGNVVGFAFENDGPDKRIPSYDSMGDDDSREIPIVFVQMDQDNNISISHTKPAVIPYAAIPSDVCITHNGITYTRYQLPLIPAHCQTIHSAQGLTAKDDVVIEPSPNYPFAMALEYVAISRVTSLQHLHLLHRVKEIHFTSHHRYRDMIATEMMRLRQAFPQNY
jgi:ATP-dependent exoDNAse (exonuclease V) alpha subunit